MKDFIIAGLDIGSTDIRLVVGQKVTTDFGGQLQIIGAVSVPAQGISKGVVTSIEEATSAISACLEKAERLIGVQVGNVWVALNGASLKCERSKGVVAVSRSDSEINQEDVSRALEAAQALSVPPNFQILHVVPVKFTVDNQEEVKSPIGMTGIRLEVETLIIQHLSSQIKNLTKAIFNARLQIEDLVFSPLAAASLVLTPKQKELGTVLINIGASTISLAVFEEGELLHTAVIPVGSNHITADIAIGLRCSIDLAERIKLRYGSALPGQFNKKDEIDISDLLSEEEIGSEASVISSKYLSEIIEARVEEFFTKIDAELKKVNRSAMLPAGAVLIGGGAKLADLVEVAKEKLRLPVTLGSNKTIATAIDKVNDLEYLTALGLLTWAEQVSRHAEVDKKTSPLKMFGNLFGKAKGLLGSLKP